METARPFTTGRAFVIRASLLTMAFYLALYFPHDPTSRAGRWLAAYLALVTRAVSGVVGLFDPEVSVAGTVLTGRFPLRVVLDCAALDAHALLAAAILAYPAPIARRLTGVVAGTALIAVVNVGRIAALYGVGVRWPAAFPLLHEDVLSLAIVAITALTFLAWAASVRRPQAAAVAHAG